MNGKIETERLLLRPLSPSDAEAVFAYSREANVGINAGWKPHESLEESEDALEKVFCGKKGIFGIVHKIDGKLIGTIGVIDDPKRLNPKAGMLGYAISESYWGKGLMTEAAQAVLRFAFGPMALIWFRPIAIRTICAPNGCWKSAALPMRGGWRRASFVSTARSWTRSATSCLKIKALRSNL